ncbi:SKP1/BTB/POZ domain-containing protein, partial [Tanacetum coccineum]
IVKVGKVAYKLKLLDNAKVHPVFHVSQLKKCLSSTTAMGTCPEGYAQGLIGAKPVKLMNDNNFDTTSRLAQWRVDDLVDSTSHFKIRECDMFSESIHTDINILASDGSIGAHRAVLAAYSPVFNNMFTHNLKEKDSSSINIPDMSIVVCHAFLSYLYSNNIQYQEFLTHRLNLLKAADKYDVTNLKDACQESLIEDIGSENVLERLQTAFMYSLPRLKVCCIKYLVKFGKIFDMEKEFNAFVQSADKELVSKVVDEIISAWKGV